MIAEQIITNVCLKKLEGLNSKEEYIKELKELVLRGKGTNKPKFSFLEQRVSTTTNMLRGLSN